MIRLLILISLALLVVQKSWGGILVGSTRVIYSEGDTNQQLMIVNTNDWPVIVQSWVDDGSANPDYPASPFIVLPAIVKLMPGQSQSVRVLKNEAKLPGDRESAYWINLYEITPGKNDELNKPRLQITMNTQLKIFWRPSSLTGNAENATKSIKFSATRDEVECSNNGPFYLSLLSLGTKYSQVEQQMDMMCPPFSNKKYPFKQADERNLVGEIKYSYKDDKGDIITTTQQETQSG